MDPLYLPFKPPSWPGPICEVEESVVAALRDGGWGSYEGEYCNRLCAKLGERFTQRYVTLSSSGTIAVELALRGVGVQPGSEVILGGYDFPGNFRAIEAVGAMPVLVDLPKVGFALSLEAIESGVSNRTSAIIVSHLHGSLASMEAIMAWSKAHGVAIVEDACQCPGATIAGKAAGSFGDVAVLSFGGSKLLTAGRGGAVMTNDERIHQRIKISQDRGNLAYPLSQLQAAAILPQLDLLDKLHQQRERAANLLYAHLPMDGDVLPIALQPESSAAYYKFPLIIQGEARDDLCMRAQSLGVPLFPGFRGFAARSTRRSRAVGELANSKRFAAQAALLHHSALLMSDSEIIRIGGALAKLGSV